MADDRLQDIIWVGTDCHGIIKWHTDYIGFESVTYDRLPISMRMPIRSIFIDRNDRLWCGTKGDGIFTIDDFSRNMRLTERNVRKFTSANSTLTNNSVYAITGSSDSTGIWIGSNGPGLNYYSYKEQKIRTVPGSEPFRNVHAILELGANTLWVGTDSKGTYKCTLAGMGTGRPVIIKTEKIRFPSPFNEDERIFSIAAQGDSLIWFGSRGKGAACLDTRTLEASVHIFSTDKGYASNDVYGMAATDKINFASGCGLVTYDGLTGEYAIADAIPHRATHGILEDWNRNLWISTNYGLICYNQDSRQSKIHGLHSGLDILEYSDGACCKDSRSKALFFGGPNGFTVIRSSDKAGKDSIVYAPAINITHHISNSIRTPLDGRLTLPFSKSPFSIKFSVVDNINYPDYRFSYRIAGYEDEWKDNGNEDIIHLPTLPPGRYSLEIRYHNRADSYTSTSEKLQIRIVPPVYARWWAITLYVLVVVGIAAWYIRLFRIKYLRLKKEVQLSQSLNNVDHTFLANMVRIIDENLGNPELSVSFIADKMCISTRVLYRKLEKAPHLKPQKLIKEARMKAAVSMLESTQMTVEEIMYKVGFDNRSTFYKNFRESYGLTPKEYREQTVK